MKKETRTVKYTEPSNYFPKSIRKKHKIGEFAEVKKDTKKTTDSKKK